MPLSILYPAGASDDFKRYAFLYRVQEKLKDVFNTSGAKFREGTASRGDWDSFVTNWYEPRMNLTINEILRLRSSAKNYKWNTKLGNTFIKV